MNILDLFFVPVAYASSVDEFIRQVNDVVLNPVIKLLFAVAFIMFFWGVVEFIRNADSDDGRSKGKQHMLWGIIGLFIMFSVWGLMQLIVDTLGLQGIDPEEGTVELNDYNPPIKQIGPQ